MAFTIRIDGSDEVVDADGDTPLLRVVCDVLRLRAARSGEVCACAAHLDGMAVCACASASAGSTQDDAIDGIGIRPASRELQAGCLDLEVVRYGYCPSGQLMWVAALLTAAPSGDADVANTSCRCRQRIRTAIHRAAA
jgi:aerobic-type carbon monoxide dehydrogenase small subunit (CoxS/CutS family)